MSTLIAPASGSGRQPLRRFTVDDYHRMIETGILDERDRVELLEGKVVLKMPRDPPHDGTLDLLRDALTRLIPSGWMSRIQQAVTLSHSEPEPDFAVVRGNKRSYLHRHPGPADIGLVVEVSDSSLDSDRDDKCRIYADAGIPIYWIVNLVDLQVEVYTNPVTASGYAKRQDLDPTMSIPFILDGVILATLPVADLLP